MMVRYNKNPNVLFFKNLSKIKKDDPTITEEEKDEIIKNRHGYWRNSIGFNISHIGLDKSSIKKSENTKKKTKRGIKKTFSFSFLKRVKRDYSFLFLSLQSATPRGTRRVATRSAKIPLESI